MRRPLLPFTPPPTTLLAITTYSLLTTLLLLTHFIPPTTLPSPAHQALTNINIDDAWHDLQRITGGWGYHPYNSRANDRVREYLVQRVGEILEGCKRLGEQEEGAGVEVEVEVIHDLESNVTFAQEGRGGSTYFEGTNLVVVVRGTGDTSSPPSLASSVEKEEAGELGAVLVNAHYDSVSTGYGATDDGTAVVTLLQLVAYFADPRRPLEDRPKRDLVFLWNNGEEDYLNGARAFAVSPLANVPKLFYNLEGAGAGGRSMLFRSTDTEVTGFYQRNVNRPFGLSVSADGFKKGLIRSQTDYKVFTEDLGMRGLDVAFWRPRSRYHTQDDDVKHTSRESLWHMLGGAIETVEGMGRDTSREFEQGFEVGGTDSVWFDLFGRAFVLLKLHTLFAINVALLVITPLIIFGTMYLLYRDNKLYMFSNSYYNGKSTHGWKGFFVYPAAFTLATSAVVSTAYLFVKVNPMIVYGNLYVVFTCFLSEWFIVAWVVAKIGQWWRASALTRGYTFGWMWAGWWGVMAYFAFLEDRRGVSSGYFVLFYYCGVFLSYWISLLEQFALPAKDTLEPTGNYRAVSPAEHHPTGFDERSRLFPSSTYDVDHRRASTSADPDDRSPGHNSASETTPLIPSSRRSSNNSSTRGRRPWPRTFRRYVDHDEDDSSSNGGGGRGAAGDDSDASEGERAVRRRGVYKYEQRWSRWMPTGWGTWVVQWVVSVPVQIVVVGEIGLLLGEALGMTGADGSDILTVYLGIAFCSILYLLPLLPFLHRITHHLAYLTIFLFLTSLIYNLVAFPFTPSARLKIYFQQSYDLRTGDNVVSLVGVDEYVRGIVERELPSAVGKEVKCVEDTVRRGLTRCSWSGIPPRVVPVEGEEGGREEWVRFLVERGERRGRARVELAGRETRNCKLLFGRPVSEIHVQGGLEGVGSVTGRGGRWLSGGGGGVTEMELPRSMAGAGGARKPPFKDRNPVPEGGTTELRLWNREWGKGWGVDVAWDVGNGTTGGEEEDVFKGRVVCMWADVNARGTVPAWDEVLAFFPGWAVPSKLADGLVEGWWAFGV